jgi:hypothetical protein
MSRFVPLLEFNQHVDRSTARVQGIKKTSVSSDSQVERFIPTASGSVKQDHLPVPTHKSISGNRPAAGIGRKHDLEGYWQKQITGRRIREVE